MISFTYKTMMISQPPSDNDLNGLNPWECFAIVPWHGEYLLYLKRDRQECIDDVKGALTDLQAFCKAIDPTRSVVHQLPRRLAAE